MAQPQPQPNVDNIAGALTAMSGSFTNLATDMAGSLAQLRTEAEHINNIPAAPEMNLDQVQNMLGQLQNQMQQLIQAQLGQRIDQLTQRVDQLTQQVNQSTQRVDQLTQQVNQSTQRVDQLTERVDQGIERLENLVVNAERHLPMRLYNLQASYDNPLQCPPNINIGDPAPFTKTTIQSMTAAQCTAVAHTLGLPPIEGNNILVGRRRQQISDFLGCGMRIGQ